MRRPAIRQQVSRTLSVPAPVGGWNTRDMLAEMKPNEAVILDNMFCLTSSVRVRPGSVDYVTAIPSDVHTLMAYRSITGTSELFAAAGTEIYDVSVAGVCGAPVLAGLANDDWQHLIFGTSAGHYMIAVNGAHLPIIYDGSAWGNIFSATFSNAISGGGLTSVGTLCTCVMTNPHNMHTGMSITVSGASQAAYNGTFVITVTNATTFTYVAASAPSASPATGGPSAVATVNFAITVANPLNFIAITQHKNRIWFAEKDTLKAWYMGTNAIGGAAAAFDLSALFSRGGYLVALGTWTLDGGAGLDDLLVFVTSEGQVAVYRGTDPAVAANWADPRKGLKEIVEFCQTLSLFTELRLRIIGDGVPAGLRELPFVQAKGRIESVEELVDQYRSSHFLVSGSVAENLPNVLLEAQLVGLPCLVRRAGGVEDIVSTGVTGLVADALAGFFFPATGT
jgi:hypothetical protein